MMSKKLFIVLIFIGTLTSRPVRAQDAMMGEIRMFAGNYPPKGWAFCYGQLLPVNQYQALFSLLGVTYGGNGQTTFALPDFRGRVPLGPGTGPGLAPHQLGESRGSESNTIVQSQLPMHTHTIPAISFNPNDPKTISAGTVSVVTTGNKSTTTINSGVGGGGQPVNNMQPYLGINFIICTAGAYPLRQD